MIILPSLSALATNESCFSAVIPVKDLIEENKEYMLVIKITLSDPSFLSEIFEAASFFGARTDAVDSLPDVFGRGNAFGMVFDIEGADVTSLLTYLTLRFSQFVTVGIYPHITEE